MKVRLHCITDYLRILFLVLILTSKTDEQFKSEGYFDGSGNISQSILTCLIIQTFPISKSYTSSIVLPRRCRALLEELILSIGLAAGAIFSRIAQQMKQ